MSIKMLLIFQLNIYYLSTLALNAMANTNTHKFGLQCANQRAKAPIQRSDVLECFNQVCGFWMDIWIGCTKEILREKKAQKKTGYIQQNCESTGCFIQKQTQISWIRLSKFAKCLFKFAINMVPMSDTFQQRFVKRAKQFYTTSKSTAILFNEIAC